MQLWEDAEKAYGTKNWSALLAISLRIAKETPSEEAFYNVALAYEHMHKYEEALEVLGAHHALPQARRLMRRLEPRPPIDRDRVSSDGEIESLRFFKSDTRFDQVIGLEKAKRYLERNVLSAITHPKLFKRYRKRVGDATILYGPPGTGKTHLARALAGEAKARMIIVRHSQLINKYAGTSEKNVHAIFEQARENTPCIIFFDEIEGISAKRSSGGDSVGEGSVIHNVINTLLAEMDGIERNPEGLFVLAATNRPWDIDSAFKRSGRFNNLLYIPPPPFGDREKLMKLYLSGKPSSRVNYRKLALRMAGYSPADIAYICDAAALEPIAREMVQKSANTITTRDILATIIREKPEGSLKYYWYDVRKELLGTMRTEMVDGKAHSVWQSSRIPTGELALYKPLIKDTLKYTAEKPTDPIRLQRFLSKFPI